MKCQTFVETNSETEGSGPTYKGCLSHPNPPTKRMNVVVAKYSSNLFSRDVLEMSSDSSLETMVFSNAEYTEGEAWTASCLSLGSSDGYGNETEGSPSIIRWTVLRKMAPPTSERGGLQTTPTHISSTQGNATKIPDSTPELRRKR